jgi:hypothetical protein
VIGGRVGRALVGGLAVVGLEVVGLAASRSPLFVASLFVLSAFFAGDIGRVCALEDVDVGFAVGSSTGLLLKLNDVFSTEVSGVPTTAEGGRATPAASSGGTGRSDRSGLFCGDCCGLSSEGGGGNGASSTAALLVFSSATAVKDLGCLLYSGRPFLFAAEGESRSGPS